MVKSWSSPSVRVVASCRCVCPAMRAWFNTPSKHCVAAWITRKICVKLWLCASTKYSTGLYSAVSGSPSEDWGKLVLPLQKQVLRFSVLLYTLTQPLIAKIYTSDSAMYSLRSKCTPLTQQYTPCGHNSRCVCHIWPHAVPLICLRTIYITVKNIDHWIVTLVADKLRRQWSWEGNRGYIPCPVKDSSSTWI